MIKQILVMSFLISLLACQQTKNPQEKTKPDTKGSQNISSSQPGPTTGSGSTHQNLPQGPVKPLKNAYKDASFETKIIEGQQNTFGYEIVITLQGKTQRIRQAHKPSVPGVRGFDTQEDAKKVADFVVNKIKTKGFPPTVTPDELKALGVLK